MTASADPVTVTGPTGETSTVELEETAPGLWRKTITADVPGLYRLQSGKLSALTHVGELNSRELSAVTATDTPLKPVLEKTGGTSFWTGPEQRDGETRMPRIALVHSGQTHWPGWLGVKERNAYEVRGVQLTPLFAGFLALALALGLLSLTWFREGH